MGTLVNGRVLFVVLFLGISQPDLICLAPPARIERAAYGLGNRRSIPIRAHQLRVSGRSLPASTPGAPKPGYLPKASQAYAARQLEVTV